MHVSEIVKHRLLSKPYVFNVTWLIVTKEITQYPVVPVFRKLPSVTIVRRWAMGHGTMGQILHKLKPFSEMAQITHCLDGRFVNLLQWDKFTHSYQILNQSYKTPFCPKVEVFFSIQLYLLGRTSSRFLLTSYTSWSDSSTGRHTPHTVDTQWRIPWGPPIRDRRPSATSRRSKQL